uniref:Uncharacterized protein n=1 Tax=Physcomitrium patens TaxID=3218 RepID=A0A7I4CRJ0_PHYPA
MVELSTFAELGADAVVHLYKRIHTAVKATFLTSARFSDKRRRISDTEPTGPFELSQSSLPNIEAINDVPHNQGATLGVRCQIQRLTATNCTTTFLPAWAGTYRAGHCSDLYHHRPQESYPLRFRILCILPFQPRQTNQKLHCVGESCGRLGVCHLTHQIRKPRSQTYCSVHEPALFRRLSDPQQSYICVEYRTPHLVRSSRFSRHLQQAR